MNNAQMLSALTALKDKVDPKTKEMIEKCESMGEDCPFIPMVYEQQATIIKEVEDAKAQEEKNAELKLESWTKVLDGFKGNEYAYDALPDEQVGEGVDLGYGITAYGLLAYKNFIPDSKPKKKKMYECDSKITIPADLAFGLIAYLNNLKADHDEKFDANLKKKSKTKKASGTRTRKEKSDDDDVWICNESSRDALKQKYEDIKEGKEIGYFAKMDDGIVYEKYDKRYPAGSTDPRDKSKTLGKDLIKMRLTACIRTTPFSYPQGSGMCAGGVQWSEGKGKNTSKFTNFKGINNDPIVQCSLKVVGDSLYCDKCAKKGDRVIKFYEDSHPKGSDTYFDIWSKYADVVSCAEKTA